MALVRYSIHQYSSFLLIAHQLSFKKIMSWRFTYLFLFIFLSSCIPAQSTQLPIRNEDHIQAFVNANSSQATAVAAIATADYFSSQLTGTAEAINQASTQQAQALQIQATERAWNATTTANSIQLTASASAAAQQAIWTQRHRHHFHCRHCSRAGLCHQAIRRCTHTRTYPAARRTHEQIRSRGSLEHPHLLGLRRLPCSSALDESPSHPTGYTRRRSPAAECRGWSCVRCRPPSYLHSRYAACGSQSATAILRQ